MLKRGVGTLSYQFEKLCQALAEGEEEKRKKFEEDGGSPRRPLLAPERKRILGTLPSFVTGTTDFQLHMEAFRDFCELNDLTDNPLKVKRLFLTSLDQTARLRCAGLEPDKPPCNTMSHIEYLNRLREILNVPGLPPLSILPFPSCSLSTWGPPPSSPWHWRRSSASADNCALSGDHGR